ncbi:MAG: AIR synthase-related protein, partial [Candidatus Caldatribacteriota bacterium]
FEIMLSESQERMVVVVKKGQEERVLSTLRKWDLDSSIIGIVTDNPGFVVKNNGKIVADIPVSSLADGAPVVKREIREPEVQKKINQLNLDKIKELDDYNEILLRLLSSPNLSCKEDIYQQYDHMVQINTILAPGDDAAVLRLKGSKKAIALTTEGNGRYCLLDPYQGAQIIVAEAARNISCKGALPRAVTDCLNFGAPENSDSYWQLVQAIKGLSEACKFFNTPIISGNVSLYNENDGKPIDPTPVIGMVGIINNYNRICTLDFKNENDIIFLLGETRDELGGSEYLELIHQKKCGQPPALNLLMEKKIQDFCRMMIEKDLLVSAHDCSLGGLAISLAESCINGGLGAEIELETNIRSDCSLFGESQSRIIVSVHHENTGKIIKFAQKEGIPIKKIGHVKGDNLKINQWVNLPVEKMEKVWRGKQ